MDLAALRMIDANLNRAREAIRTLEDVARFAWNDRAIAEEAKSLRHALQAAVAAIAAIPGFGPWTAEVHLLFGHDRQDLFPAGELALAASLAALRGLPGRPSPKELAVLAKAWRPWRSMAARLLWHHWRHVTGRPAGEAG